MSDFRRARNTGPFPGNVGYDQWSARLLGTLGKLADLITDRGRDWGTPSRPDASITAPIVFSLWNALLKEMSIHEKVSFLSDLGYDQTTIGHYLAGTWILNDKMEIKPPE